MGEQGSSAQSNPAPPVAAAWVLKKLPNPCLANLIHFRWQIRSCECNITIRSVINNFVSWVVLDDN